MSILIILLLFGIFSWIHYLFKNNYIIECYENALSSDKGDFTTTHTVNLPLTTNFSCSNMCINARCSKTKEQCLSDIDCPDVNHMRVLVNQTLTILLVKMIRENLLLGLLPHIQP